MIKYFALLFILFSSIILILKESDKVQTYEFEPIIIKSRIQYYEFEPFLIQGRLYE
tara:strand:- start:2090 stop:2257 length:168 start_codon:yes stop_codon:yes gene_type:complete